MVISVDDNYANFSSENNESDSIFGIVENDALDADGNLESSTTTPISEPATAFLVGSSQEEKTATTNAMTMVATESIDDAAAAAAGVSDELYIKVPAEALTALFVPATILLIICLALYKIGNFIFIK